MYNETRKPLPRYRDDLALALHASWDAATTEAAPYASLASDLHAPERGLYPEPIISVALEALTTEGTRAR